jgi:hypothetical protein
MIMNSEIPEFIDASGQKYRLYATHYVHDYKTWAINFWARDVYDAEVKFQAIQKSEPKIIQIVDIQ